MDTDFYLITGTFEVQFNHTFYSEVVSLTCEVEITSTAVTVNYLTLSGETLNGIEFFGVDGFFSNLNYSIDSQTGFGTYSFTINLEVVLMTEACLVVPVSSITVNDYSQYNFINYMTTRYTTETLEEFISTSALAARTLDNVDAEGSLDLYFSPQSRILNTDGFWVFGNMSSVVGTKEPIATTVINSGYEYNTTLYRSESTTHSYDYGMGPSFSIDYSTKYHYHYYVTLNDVVQSSQMSIIQSFYKSHVSALGRDAAIVVYVIDTSYAHNNVYGGATNESFDTVTNLVKSITLRLSIEQDGSISTVEDNNSVVNLASSTSYMLNGYYMSANRQYTYVGQSPIPTFTGLYNFDFCYEYDYQYSEVCDASYLIVGGANFYPYTYKYAPITDPSECVYQSYGTSSLGFSIIKHDDRRTTGTLSSAADVVIAELARGEYTMNSIGEYLGYTFSRMGVGFDPSANIHRDYAAGKLFGKGYALLTENFRQSLYNGVTPYITSRWGSATSYYSYLTEYVVPICNSYTVAGNLGSVINVDTQLLEDYLRYDNPDGLFPRNYSPTGGTCPTFSTDILPLVNFTWLNLYSLSIESTAYRLTNVDSCGTYNVNAVHTWYSVSGILNMYLDNYQNYYPSFYFSSKNMVAIAMDGYRKFGITNSLANIGLISMLTWWRYSYLANTRHYSIVALYRVKNSTIVGIAIGAFRKLKSKDSQYTTLCAATTETAWNAARQAIIDDWVLIHNNNIPQSLIDVMPILCIRSSVVHVFEDFKSQYAFYT